ncbi:11878_t:CDS:2, partial [Ambispora leptoticha]
FLSFLIQIPYAPKAEPNFPSLISLSFILMESSFNGHKETSPFLEMHIYAYKISKQNNMEKESNTNSTDQVPPPNNNILDDINTPPPPDPLTMYCPYCQQQVLTTVTRIPGARAYCCSALLCCVFWPLFWLPCVMKECQDEFHHCSRCKRVLAIIEDEP